MVQGMTKESRWSWRSDVPQEIQDRAEVVTTQELGRCPQGLHRIDLELGAAIVSGLCVLPFVAGWIWPVQLGAFAAAALPGYAIGLHIHRGRLGAWQARFRELVLSLSRSAAVVPAVGPNAAAASESGQSKREAPDRAFDAARISALLRSGLAASNVPRESVEAFYRGYEGGVKSRERPSGQTEAQRAEQTARVLELIEQYRDKGDPAEFMAAIQSLKTGANAAWAAQEGEPPVSIDGRILIARRISNLKDIRLISPKQVDEGKGLRAIIGVSDPAEWEFRYIPRAQHTLNRSRLPELFESALPASGVDRQAHQR